MLLLTIYKSFIRTHLDYGDVIYDQAYTASFRQKIESVQYNSALATTGAIRGTSKEKRYHELGLESLKKEDGTGNCASFIKYSETNLQNMYSILFLLLRDHTTQEMLIIFFSSK